jgi:lysophospholipase L1-like esterase
MRTSTIFCIGILGFFFLSCQKELPKQTYLALGDSYTIGERVEAKKRWPVQLVDSLKKYGIEVAEPQIIAQTGWTTDELKAGIDAATLDFPYDWVSLLIGVNNQYRGRSINEFRQEFEGLLSEAVLFSGNRKERVFVVSIPDWGVMPFAEGRDREQIATEIDNFNQVIYEVCAIEGIQFIDITPISREVASHPEWIAQDGLHPSGAQYSQWVQTLLPYLLKKHHEGTQ